MKLTKQQLKQVIKEELGKVLKEYDQPRWIDSVRTDAEFVITWSEDDGTFVEPRRGDNWGEKINPGEMGFLVLVVGEPVDRRKEEEEVRGWQHAYDEPPEDF